MYLGRNIKTITIILTMILMVMVGAVFVTGPAKLLENLTTGGISMNTWMIIIVLYYLIATLLPIDKIIGKIYPVFGFALLFMAVGIGFMIVKNGLHIPDLTIENLRNFHSNPEKFRVFPMMFITIACGAISGFHSTQSPMMARCLVNEKLGHKVFYGAMITEGIVAMIWAAAAMGFYNGPDNLNSVLASHNFNAAVLVDDMAHSMLGKVGGILAIIGVIAAPISTGDTALRSARLIAADFLKIRQIKPASRLKTSIPIFLLTILLTQVRFDIIWRYFSWANQTLAMIILWTITVYLHQNRKPMWITLIPALFMTMTTMTYIFFSQEGFGLQYHYALGIGAGITMVFCALFYVFKVRKS
jgi:carbon starvation protein CstA